MPSAHSTGPGRTLLPDCGGAIERIAIALPPPVLNPENPLCEPLRGLVRSLSPDCTLVVLTEQGDEPRAQEWLERFAYACRAVIVATVPRGGFARAPAAEWIQDRFLCGFDRGVPHYLTPEDEVPSHAAWLGGAEGTPTSSIPVRLEGGNCLVGEDFWLVGCDSVRMTADLARTPHDLDAAAVRIAGLHDVPLHIAGYGPLDVSGLSLPRLSSGPGGAAIGLLRQPWFHLDLMISVTGMHMNGRRHLLVADPSALATSNSTEARAQGARLDAMAERLKVAGFSVGRNPVAFAPSSITASARPRGYNNVLVENRPKPRVWLPQFADVERMMTEFDDANRTLWVALGFEVIPLYGWSHAAGFGGAVRCISKVLARR